MLWLSGRRIADLVAATGSVGNDEGFVGGGADGGQQIQLSHLHGDVVVLGFVAEGAGHAAAGAGYGAHFEFRDELEDGFDGAHAVEGLLVAVAVEQGAFFR